MVSGVAHTDGVAFGVWATGTVFGACHAVAGVCLVVLHAGDGVVFGSVVTRVTLTSRGTVNSDEAYAVSAAVDLSAGVGLVGDTGGVIEGIEVVAGITQADN